MKVSEAIKNNDSFIITKDKKILAINNKYGDDVVEDEILNSEVKKIQVINGVIKDLTCIRL
jgi:hypothetical protein